MENKRLREGVERKKSTTKKIIFTILVTVVTTALLGCAAIALYINYIIGLMNHVDGKSEPISPEEMQDYIREDMQTYDPDFTGDRIEPEDVVLETVGESIFDDTGVLNILLIGQDARPGEDRARSDTMILCSINKQTGTLTFVSFMRDMYVSIPDYCYYKMNAAYAWGDMALLNETVLVNFGVQVHGDVSVDFSAFEAVIDKIGGVNVTLTASEARYLGSRYSAGENCLDGEAALAYARLRSIGDGDFDRTARQRKVLQGIMEKCSQMSLAELNGLLETLLPLLDTNIAPEKLRCYATELLPILGKLTLGDGVQIPAEGTYRYAWVRDMSVLMPDLAENRKWLQEALYGT